MMSVEKARPGAGARNSCRSREASSGSRLGATAMPSSPLYELYLRAREAELAAARPSSRISLRTTFSETTTGRAGSSEAAPRAL